MQEPIAQDDQVLDEGVPVEPEPPVEPEQEPDPVAQFAELKAQFEAERAKWDKERENFRSQEISALKQEQRDRYLETLSESLSSLAEAMGNDEVSSKLADINAKYRQEALTAEFTAEVERTLGVITEIGQEIDLDIKTAPEFETAGLYYQKAIETGQSRWLDKAETEALRVQQKIERERSRKALAEADRRAESARKRAFEDSGILETGTGGSAASAAEPPVTELAARYGRGDDSLTEAQVAKVREYLKTGLSSVPFGAQR